MKRRSIFLLLFLIPLAAWALQTVSKSFTGTGTSAWLLVRNGDSFSYSVSGTFVGTVFIERTRNGGVTWDPVTSSTKATSGSIRCETSNGKAASYRVRCSTYTSGTIVTSLSDIDTAFQEFSGKGRSPVLTLKNESVELVGAAVAGPTGTFAASVSAPSVSGSTGTFTVYATAPKVSMTSGTVSSSLLISTQTSNTPTARLSVWGTGSSDVVSISTGGAGSPVSVKVNNDGEVVLGSTPTVKVQFLGGLMLPPNPAPRTNVTPPGIYSVIVNSTVPEVCWSTGTAKETWCVWGSSYTACSN